MTNTSLSDKPFPGKLYRHQDGGFYLFVTSAICTETQVERYIYEHVWPFEQGKRWVRPAQEWASRFKPACRYELLAAKEVDRNTAQQAVIKAREVRRASAGATR